MSSTKRALPLACLVALAAVAQAPAPRPEACKAPDATSTVMQQLLVESYLLTTDLPPNARMYTLSRAASLAGTVDSGLTRLWAEELLRVSAQLAPGSNRQVTEGHAATALAAIDEDRAMEILVSMDGPIADRYGSVSDDFRDLVAGKVFPAYWRKHGTCGLDQIRAAAAQLAANGEYPYAAVATLISDLTRGDPQTARALEGDAIVAYQHGSRVQSANSDFLDFLQQTKAEIPPATFKEALQALVRSLAEPAGSPEAYRVIVHTDKGAATFDSRNEETLFYALPLIRQADPDWADRIQREHPAQAGAAGAAGKVTFIEGTTTTGTTHADAAAEKKSLEESRLREVSAVATDDPQRAMRLAVDLSDPAIKWIALARVAGGWAHKDPAKGEKLLDEVQHQVASVSEPEDRLAVLTAIGQAAAALHDSNQLQQAAKRAYPLGDDLFQQDLDTHPGKPFFAAAGMRPLDVLTTAVAKLDWELARSLANTVRNPLLRANLLLSVVQGMRDGGVSNSLSSKR